MDRVKQYFLNSSIHGLHYIAESERHWTERLFWIFTCCLSGFCTWYYIIQIWYAFQNNSVSFVVESDYLDWNTTFPAVTVCEEDTPEKLYDAATELVTRLFGEDRNFNMDFFLKDIAFFEGVCYSCSKYCGVNGTNCKLNLLELVVKTRSKCDDLLDTCAWNGKKIDCCEHFRPLKTENGLCFSINSMHTKKSENSVSEFISNKKTGLGALEISTDRPIKVYFHSREDVPNNNHSEDEKMLLQLGFAYMIKIKVKEIKNDRNLPLVAIDKRKCRLPEENSLEVYNYYSYSACVVNCRATLQIRLCNCTSHFMPYKNEESQKPVCGVTGLICLTEYYEILQTLKPVDLQKMGMDCGNPSNESQYGTGIVITLDSLPVERYKRNVVRTRLELVVSIGETIGLFLGASILSFIEIIYYICIKMNSFEIRKLKNTRRFRKANH